MTASRRWTLESFHEYASQYLVDGVSSSFRMNPFTKLPNYLSRAQGAFLWDITQKKYIDFFMGHGAILLGHNHPAINGAIRSILKNGFLAEYDSFLTAECARIITEVIPCAEKVRFTNSGSEATQLAMRIARGYTGKDIIVRIDGHFHGVYDYVLFNNLARYRDLNNKGRRPSETVLSSSGIPKAVPRTVIVIPWNDAGIFEQVVQERGEEIAAIMMNPIDYNNGCITTTSEYLGAINSIAHENNILVIYDEILSGFRTGISCAQGYYGITPDICTLGKAISNGVPLSVVAGRAQVMSTIVAGELPVVAGGTFSGNLLGVASAIAALTLMREDGFFERLLGSASYFFQNLQDIIDDHDLPARVQHLGSNFFVYFGVHEPVVSYHQFADIDGEFASKFFQNCIREGLYFHTDFTVSAAHTRNELDTALAKIDGILSSMKRTVIPSSR